MDDTELLSSSDQKMDDASTENPAAALWSDDSGDSDSDSEDEAESNHQIETLESELSANPYNYDAYVQVRIFMLLLDNHEILCIFFFLVGDGWMVFRGCVFSNFFFFFLLSYFSI